MIGLNINTLALGILVAILSDRVPGPVAVQVLEIMDKAQVQAIADQAQDKQAQDKVMVQVPALGQVELALELVLDLALYSAFLDLELAAIQVQDTAQALAHTAQIPM
jgi:hypothetical protein